MSKLNKLACLSLVCCSPFLASQAVHASGMKLETSVVIVNTADGEGVMTLKNTDSKPVLLYSSVENLPGDKEESLIVTPPVVRVNPGDSQTVRFMLKTPGKNVEQFKRAIFEGIPATDKSADKLQITIRQNVPLIIHPSALKDNPEPWKDLKWQQVNASSIKVTNTGSYVIRMSPEITLLPKNIKGSMGGNYILPGQSRDVTLRGTVSGAQMVQITPANKYGYFVKPYETELSSH
ncbi:Capsule protein fraction 1 [Buttiauxella agrestis]|uniref:Capsule protein fraction 1 n=1 Tax=Buttiauxella agrestis TaxID=82977 RepID=A0A381KPL8_9ENTR|nr:fimbria/pilus chaperone family protein [Buttiauxella agrestis]SUY92952.1 Capsule protein fraction 1 [Buttiauxella agrestis]